MLVVLSKSKTPLVINCIFVDLPFVFSVEFEQREWISCCFLPGFIYKTVEGKRWDLALCHRLFFLSQTHEQNAESSYSIRGCEAAAEAAILRGRESPLNGPLLVHFPFNILV